MLFFGEPPCGSPLARSRCTEAACASVTVSGPIHRARWRVRVRSSHLEPLSTRQQHEELLDVVVELPPHELALGAHRQHHAGQPEAADGRRTRVAARCGGRGVEQLLGRALAAQVLLERVRERGAQPGDCLRSRPILCGEPGRESARSSSAAGPTNAQQVPSRLGLGRGGARYLSARSVIVVVA
eukprot:2053602-Prymnesium_polylepis.2